MSINVEEELPPSKLGTKEHWDMVYERENAVFEDNGDEGEVWFGESSVSKMRAWASKHLSTTSSSSPLRIMECGAGNGTLLLSFLTSPSHLGVQHYDLTGLDYSSGSTRLSAQIEAQRRADLPIEIEEYDSDDDDEDLGQQVMNMTTCTWRTVDLLRDEIGEEWDLVMDKGTFDALCLSQEGVKEKGDRLPSVVYPEQVARLVKEGGYFLITSCNFTEEEIRRRWTVDGLSLEFHFGGKTGTTVCTVAFKKVAN